MWYIKYNANMTVHMEISNLAHLAYLRRAHIHSLLYHIQLVLYSGGLQSPVQQLLAII